MVYPIENQMVVDAAWDWNESMSPDKKRLKRERQAYEEAEREDRENESIKNHYQESVRNNRAGIGQP